MIMQTTIPNEAYYIASTTEFYRYKNCVRSTHPVKVINKIECQPTTLHQCISFLTYQFVHIVALNSEFKNGKYKRITLTQDFGDKIVTYSIYNSNQYINENC